MIASQNFINFNKEVYLVYGQIITDRYDVSWFLQVIFTWWSLSQYYNTPFPGVLINEFWMIILWPDVLPGIKSITCILLCYKLLIRTTVISGACKRTHRDLQHSNRIIYVRDNPCATGEDLNHSPRKRRKCMQYVNMIMLLIIKKSELPYYITVE